MITIYYLCGGYAVGYFSQFLKSVKNIYVDTPKKIVLITNDSKMTLFDEYEKNNVSIEVHLDNELSIIPLNKIDELQKFISNGSDYSIFINPNAMFINGVEDISLLNNKLYFGYIDKQNENNESQEYYGFGSIVYGPTEIFNKAIKFGRDYEFVEDENRTDEQKFIRFIESNPITTEYRESSDLYKFIDEE